MEVSLGYRMGIGICGVVEGEYDVALGAERVHIPVHWKREVDEKTFWRVRLRAAWCPRRLGFGIGYGMEGERLMLDFVLRSGILEHLHIAMRTIDYKGDILLEIW